MNTIRPPANPVTKAIVDNAQDAADRLRRDPAALDSEYHVRVPPGQVLTGWVARAATAVRKVQRAVSAPSTQQVQAGQKRLANRLADFNKAVDQGLDIGNAEHALSAARGELLLSEIMPATIDVKSLSVRQLQAHADVLRHQLNGSGKYAQLKMPNTIGGAWAVGEWQRVSSELSRRGVTKAQPDDRFPFLDPADPRNSEAAERLYGTLAIQHDSQFGRMWPPQKNTWLGDALLEAKGRLAVQLANTPEVIPSLAVQRIEEHVRAQREEERW